jgi:hypothetical protein
MIREGRVSNMRRSSPFRLPTAALGLVGLMATTSWAQLDPLLFLKRVPPTVILVVDTSLRMLENGDGDFYDPNTYLVADDVPVASALGVGAALNYRRIYRGLLYEAVQSPDSKFETSDILAVPNTSPQYPHFWAPTRLEIAKQGIAQAVGANAGYRWGLIQLRQSGAQWRTKPDCDAPVRVTGNALLQTVADQSPCAAGTGRFGIYTPSVTVSNFSIEATPGDAVLVPAGNNTATAVLTRVQRPVLDPQGLIPAGLDTREYEDRPLTHALEDARSQAVTAMVADPLSTRTCRNTIVVLITSGGDDGGPTYRATHNPVSVAGTFASVTAGGVTRRVPIYVAAIRPATAAVSQLEQIASGSGGRYFSVSRAAGVASVINLAVQAGFARPLDLDTGVPSEFQTVSPVVGTVDLKRARDAQGNTLAYTEIETSPGGMPVPQRSNVLLTSGFTLPGFDGSLRAFRAYTPVIDLTKPIGWKFVKDGTPLWPDLDGRPHTAGRARLPVAPSQRNIYTFIPGSGMVSFTEANGSLLAPHLGGVDPALLIPFVRTQPLGAIINSTPAVMNPPSLDPPPDDDYGRPEVPGTFAATHRHRRSIIWVGANDGMLHAIDARTGFEVWAFVPYNLLPKLRTLLDGQPVEQFDYFVDGSPKLAEVKLGGQWRTLLLIGQGAGGTFYQAFDVTNAGNGGPPPDSDAHAAVLASFANPAQVEFKWAFPRYSSFNPSYSESFALTDGSSSGRVTFHGDLHASASFVEKTVGFTWSTPVLGPLDAARTTNVAMVGSGYFPDVESQLPGRGASAPKAGRFFYLLRLDDGTLLGNPAGSACEGTGCIDAGDLATNTRKNALQADPAAAGDSGSPLVKKVYIGDVDGRFWRFDFTAAGAITSTQMVTTGQPIYGSAALMHLGTANQYMYFATGSDLLPATTSGGIGTFKLFGLEDNFPAAGATTLFTRDLAPVTIGGGLVSGERASTSPSVAGDIVFYTTTAQDGSAPCGDFTARLYGLTYLGSAAYDTDGSGSMTNNESPIISTLAGRATAPFVVDQHLYFGTTGTSGAAVEAFGDPEGFNKGVGQVGVRILSWREIR